MMRYLPILAACLVLLAFVGQAAHSTTVAIYGTAANDPLRVTARINSLGYTTLQWGDPSLVTPENLDQVDVLYVLPGAAMWLVSQDIVIQDFVRNGGGLIVEQPNIEGPVSILPPELGVSVSSRRYNDLSVQITGSGMAHPATAGLLPADIPGNMDVILAGEISPEYIVLAVSAVSPDEVAVAAAEYGKGKVIVETGNIHPWSLQPGSDAYVHQIISWVSMPAPSALEVAIDIKPGEEPNSINLKSKGVIPVAVLTTEEFDASTVDPATVLFADAVPVRWCAEDVDGDGDSDLMCHFRTQELNLAADSTEAVLVGSTAAGQSIQGADSVGIVPGK